jgi:hypothetical protein
MQDQGVDKVLRAVFIASDFGKNVYYHPEFENVLYSNFIF